PSAHQLVQSPPAQSTGNMVQVPAAHWLAVAHEQVTSCELAKPSCPTHVAPSGHAPPQARCSSSVYPHGSVVVVPVVEVVVVARFSHAPDSVQTALACQRPPPFAQDDALDWDSGMQCPLGAPSSQHPAGVAVCGATH